MSDRSTTNKSSMASQRADAIKLGQQQDLSTWWFIKYNIIINDEGHSTTTPSLSVDFESKLTYTQYQLHICDNIELWTHLSDDFQQNLYSIFTLPFQPYFATNTGYSGKSSLTQIWCLLVSTQLWPQMCNGAREGGRLRRPRGRESELRARNSVRTFPIGYWRVHS